MIAWLLGLALAQEPKLDWYALPVAAADTDDGAGGGFRAEIARIEEGYAPYKWAWMTHAYLTTTGYQHHQLRFDRVGIGSRHRLRLTVRIAWRAWKNDGYWGIGNGTTLEPGFVGTFAADDPRRKRYRYSLFQPFGYLTLRHEVGRDSPWEVFASFNPKLSRIATYPDSRLEQEQPLGMEGGVAVVASTGVLHDTREPEIRPRAGHLFEVSGRVAPQLPGALGGEAGGWGGPLVSARVFTSLGERVVLGGRVVGEYLLGSVPFYEMVHWGGAIPISGMGGYETIRGISFGRFRAPGKAVANLELRVDTLRHRLGKSSQMEWEIAPFVDAGTVWGAGSGPAEMPVHPGAGLGVRPVLNETFVGRLDAAVGLDRLEGPTGEEVRPTFGFYMVFDHPF